MGDIALNLRTVAIAVTVSIIAAAAAVFAYLETMAHVRYVDQNRHPGYHAIYQFREHHLRLLSTLQDYLDPGALVDHDTLIERFDVLWSRLTILVTKETRPFLGDGIEAERLIAELQQILDRVDPLIQRLEPGDEILGRRIIERLGALSGPYEAFRRIFQWNTDIRRNELVAEAKRLGYIQIVLLTISFLAGGTLCLVVVRQAQRAQYLALHDPLTGLPNRAQLEPVLTMADQEVISRDRFVAIHCIDLDRFKSINDTLGHPVGDALLIAVGQRLAENIRSTDMVIRLGGDEFAIVQRNIANIAEAESMAERLVRAGTSPFLVGDNELLVGISVGCAVFPRDADSIGSLIEKADLALYEAKRLGRQTYKFFDSSLQEQALRQRYLESELRQALANDELEVHFQPQYRLSDHALTGAEALLRWRHPQHGPISPAEFIPIAEECGLIGPIGTMVLKTACEEAHHWHELCDRDLHVSVNLSPAQFERQDIAAIVLSVLSQSKLPSELLEIEITENLLLNNNKKIKEDLGNLRNMGISIALDDFGTGYSSLSYLNQFPFNKIKIDRSFIMDLDPEADGSPFIEAIVHLAQRLGMVVVAEGVESEAQLQALARMGCDEVQGFYLGRPEPASAFRQRIGIPSAACGESVRSDEPRVTACAVTALRH